MSRVLAAPALLLVCAFSLVVAGASLAAGPSLPALDGARIASANGTVGYVAKPAGTRTRVEERIGGRTARTLTLPGGYGIQLATLGGDLAGLSANGRVLVLSDDVEPDGSLRPQSRFAVVDTGAMTLAQEITLHGDYSIDALSPRGDLLYLIHHVSQRDASRYQVRAYDLAKRRMLPGVVADKRQAGWVMAGYPVARTARASGAWVYTLYQQGGNYPFIHALDTVDHTAVCVGLPDDWVRDAAWLERARLRLAGDKLRIETHAGKLRFVVDTRTFRVSTR
jgi:hypothetical protein